MPSDDRLIRRNENSEALEFARHKQALLAALTSTHPSEPVDAAAHIAAPADSAADRLRNLVASSLEGGLLRYSRRLEILEQARELGFSEFQAHLLIAETQFGGPPLLRVRPVEMPAAQPRWAHAAARWTATAVLALTLFTLLVTWAGQ